MWDFDEVEVHGEGGADQGFLVDSALADLFEGDANWGKLSSVAADFAHLLYDFDYIKVDDGGDDGDTKDVAGPLYTLEIDDAAWDDI